MKHSCTVSEYNLKLYFEAFVVCDWLLDCSVRDTRSVLDRDVYAEANSCLDPVHFCPLLFPPSFFFIKKLTHWNECACCHEQTLGHSVAFSSAVPYAHTAARWGQLGLRHNGSYCSTTHCVIDLFTVHWLTECVASSVFHSIFVWTDAVPVENAFVFLLLEVHYNDSVTFIKLEAWTETDLKKSLSEPAEVEMSRHIERLFTTYPTVKIW